ncbi:MAG: PilZ domain-containing protein [Armatimonadetes bacterium]|nr:PilZ domain-containing protein [Armatimonadota bacterium]
MSFANFVQRRARVQRHRDAKNFSGWIRQITQNQVVLEFTQVPELAHGETVLVEIHGDDGCASFKASVAETKSNFAVLRVIDRFKVFTANESPRIKVEGIQGKLTIDGQEHPITVGDVSEKGLGVIAPVALTQGSKVELEINTGKQTLSVTGSVRYCRQLKDSGNYRCGLIVSSSGRLDSARWDTFRKSFSNAA